MFDAIYGGDDNLAHGIMPSRPIVTFMQFMDNLSKAFACQTTIYGVEHMFYAICGGFSFCANTFAKARE